MNIEIIYQHFLYLMEEWGVVCILSLLVLALLIWLVIRFRHHFKLLPLASLMVIIVVALWYNNNSEKLKKQQQILQDSISSDNELSGTEAVNIFHHMIERYYPGSLPNSFYEYSNLYIEAIRNRANIISQPSTLCPEAELNSNQIWDSIQLNALQLNQIVAPQIEGYEQACLTQATESMKQERLYGDTPLYEFSSLQDRNQQIANFTAPAEALIAEPSKIRELEFVNASNSPTTERSNSNFYWSVDLLNEAKNAFQQYEQFANAHYPSLRLPVNPGEDVLSIARYQAQFVTLKHLQITMTNLISRSRKDKEVLFEPASLRSVDQQEANLAARVANFNKAMDSLISLTRIFQQLGFDDTHSWFKELSQGHAFGILQQIEQLYNANRLYEPRTFPNRGSQHYLNALFGIDSAEQLKDYLNSQNEKAKFFVTGYAQAIIEFLQNSGQEYLNDPLVGGWRSSMMEINKYLKNDPTSSLSLLESYFKNQLSVTQQSNCLEKTQGFVKPQKDDIFSLSHRNIIILAESYCKANQKETIKKTLRSTPLQKLY